MPQKFTVNTLHSKQQRTFTCRSRVGQHCIFLLYKQERLVSWSSCHFSWGFIDSTDRGHLEVTYLKNCIGFWGIDLFRLSRLWSTSRNTVLMFSVADVGLTSLHYGKFSVRKLTVATKSWKSSCQQDLNRKKLQPICQKNRLHWNSQLQYVS